MGLPLLRFAESIQRFRVQHLAAYPIMIRAAQELYNLSGGYVLWHKVTLLLHKLFPNGLAEFHTVLAAAVDGHGFRPHLFDVGTGGFFVVENVTFSLFAIAQYRQKSPVPSTIQRKKVHGVRRSRKHTLTLTVAGLLNSFINLTFSAFAVSNIVGWKPGSHNQGTSSPP